MLTIAYLLSTTANVFITYKLLKAMLKYRPKKPAEHNQNLDDMPSVSILIPARNEQHAMHECLERVLASDYPKMEIVVLDDNSVDDTPSEVKLFAHSGVRFVRGEEPPAGWLGRNYAYERLSKEASGDYFLFLSVDTKLASDSISKMVKIMNEKNTEMVSILPSRVDNYRFSVLFSTLRYYIALITARRNSPPSSSAAWMIKRDLLLDKLGGFTNFRQSVMPESNIARILNTMDGEFIKSSDCSYQFLIDGGKCGVSFEKRWSSQLQTEQRNYTLKILKNGGLIFAVLPIFIFHLLPFFIVLARLATLNFDLYFWLFLAQVTISCIIYGVYLSLVWSRGFILGALLYPAVLAQELCIFISSIYKRFFGRMIWRGREIEFRKY